MCVCVFALYDFFTMDCKISPVGNSPWGIAYYLNGVLIPRITLYRHVPYTFVIEGGNDPSNPARYHPFYITSSERGGYLALSDSEKQVCLSIAYQSC